MALKKARKAAAPFKGSIQGASGSGKTITALKIMKGLVERTTPGKRIAVIDTDKGCQMYSNLDFDVDDDFGEGKAARYAPRTLIEKMEAIMAEKDANGERVYGGVIIDSLTHFHKEPGGMLSMIDDEVAKMKASGKQGDSFAAWKTVDKVHRAILNYIRNYPMHVIATVRCKQKIERENGKLRKIGLEPEYRDGFEYEMDAQFAIDDEHVLVTKKHRLGDYLDDKVFNKPGDDLAEVLFTWANDGEAQEKAPVTPAQVAESKPVPGDGSRATMPGYVTDVEPEHEKPAPEPLVSHKDEVTDHLAHCLKLIADATTEAENTAAGKVATAFNKDKKFDPGEFAQITDAFKAKRDALKAAATA